jgi:zinc and cadmium transporter
MQTTGLLALYCVLILLASLAGGWLPHVVRLTHKRLELAVSFVSGVMLGVALLHLLPHALGERLAWEEGVAAHGGAVAPIDSVMLWLVWGFLVMFLIERFFCFHHHDAPPAAGVDAVGASDAAAHEHPGCAAHTHAGFTRHRITWFGAMLGLTLHTLIEGLALGASVLSGAEADQGAAAAGLGTFLVILLHKPFDAMTLATLMTIGGRSTRFRHLVNAAFALVVPLGAAGFILGVGGLDGAVHLWLARALAFSAGTFLCICLSDLLPELQFHQHDRLKLSAALIAGLALAWGVGLIESEGHDHAAAGRDLPADVTGH